MNELNRSVTLATIPQVNIDTYVATRQFLSRNSLKDYFKDHMNYLYRDASEAVNKKAFFHSMNFILPYFKFTLIQAADIDCGSNVSNN